MFKINTDIKDGAVYPDDFSMLQNGQDFAMKKEGDDYIIQTIVKTPEEIKQKIESFLEREGKEK